VGFNIAGVVSDPNDLPPSHALVANKEAGGSISLSARKCLLSRKLPEGASFHTPLSVNGACRYWVTSKASDGSVLGIIFGRFEDAIQHLKAKGWHYRRCY